MSEKESEGEQRRAKERKEEQRGEQRRTKESKEEQRRATESKAEQSKGEQRSNAALCGAGGPAGGPARSKLSLLYVLRCCVFCVLLFVVFVCNLASSDWIFNSFNFCVGRRQNELLLLLLDSYVFARTRNSKTFNN